MSEKSFEFFEWTKKLIETVDKSATMLLDKIEEKVSTGNEDVEVMTSFVLLALRMEAVHHRMKRVQERIAASMLNSKD